MGIIHINYNVNKGYKKSIDYTYVNIYIYIYNITKLLYNILLLITYI